MSLSSIQSEVLRVLAANRGPGSYVAGASPLNSEAPRRSHDIDIFHDREEGVSAAALADAKTLEEAGYRITWLRQLPLMYTAEVEKGSERTRLEWVVDSDFRFFPAVQDEIFGFRLHPVDLATNKVMAAAGRREVRDLVDLVTIHEHVLPLGAVVWAAVEKAPGFTPEGLIAEVRRNSNYPAAEWRAVQSDKVIDPTDTMARLRKALDEAEAFVSRMPTDRMGLLFIKDGMVVQPDPDRLASYETHAGRRQGHWPTNRDIAAAMFLRDCNSWPKPTR
jgi:hypothetical protein